MFGPPGSGKGTYASRLSAELSVPHISTGDLVREAIGNQTDTGKRNPKVTAKSLRRKKLSTTVKYIKKTNHRVIPKDFF